MTSPVRSVNVDHVSRLMEAVRIGGELDMEKFLRDIWARHDPDRDRKLSGLPPKTTSPQEAGP